MASSGDGNDKPKWPGPVTINDEDPKRFFTIFLSLPKLKVAKSMGVFGKSEPKNADIHVQFNAESLAAKASVNDKEGKTVKYEYEKSLPEDINDKESYWKVKEGRLMLYLSKQEAGSWGQHSKHFISQ